MQLYDHNQAAIEAGIEDELTQVNLPERQYRIPLLDELRKWLLDRRWPQNINTILNDLHSAGVTGAWQLSGPDHEVIAVGAMNMETYRRNYARGPRYRCVAKAIDAVILDPRTGEDDTQDPGDLLLSETQGSSRPLAKPARKKTAALAFKRLCIRETYEVEWKELSSSARHAAPGLIHQNRDRKYWVPSPGLLQRALRRSKIDKHRYVSERFDCDDFSTVVKADLLKIGITAVGFVEDESSSHAYLALATLDNVGDVGVHFIEPQSDKKVKLGEGNYKGLSGTVKW